MTMHVECMWKKLFKLNDKGKFIKIFNIFANWKEWKLKTECRDSHRPALLLSQKQPLVAESVASANNKN